MLTTVQPLAAASSHPVLNLLQLALLLPSVQSHFRLFSPGRLLVPELDTGDVAIPAGEIERGARPVRAHPHAERVGAGLVVPVLDLDAIELHRSAADPELESPVLVLAVATALVVVDA